MKFISKAIYHFFQYYIKPTHRHRWIIRKARQELRRIRMLPLIHQTGYLMGFLRRVDPFVFEELLLLCFKERGFRVKRNAQHTGDGGIDGTVFNSVGQKILIQVKRYSHSINPQHIVDFTNTIHLHTALGGYFIHTGRTGYKSKELKNENIKILSGDTLLQFILKN